MDEKLFNKIVTALVLILFTCIGSIFFIGKEARTFSRDKKLPIYSVEGEGQKIAFTFDINWADKDYIYEILDILKEKDIKATFFVMGGWIEYSDENVEKLKRIYEEGHEIGNHSNKHPDMSRISKESMIKEIEITDGIIKKYLGIDTKLFRCPSGSYNDSVVQVVEDSGHYCIQWDVDSIDWKEHGAEIEYERVIKGVKSGSIVLFHNNSRYTPGNLSRLIDNLKNKGYTFVIISQLIHKDNYYIDNTGRQIIN